MIEKGTFSFAVESRLLRELGEWLVKQPEVAVAELVKNACGADATECMIDFDREFAVGVGDDGRGMSLEQFRNGWMRIGTSSREQLALSSKFARPITGEKGNRTFCRQVPRQGLAFGIDSG